MYMKGGHTTWCSQSKLYFIYNVSFEKIQQTKLIKVAETSYWDLKSEHTEDIRSLKIH